MRLLVACIAGWLSILGLTFLIGAALGSWINILGFDPDISIQVLRYAVPSVAVFIGIAIAIFIFNGGTFEDRRAVVAKSRSNKDEQL